MRPAKTSEFGLGSGAKPKGRPVQGNSPDDRLLRGPGCYRLKRVCADFFPASSFALSTILRAPRMRFFRHRGIYRSDKGSFKNQTWAKALPPAGGSSPGSRTRREDHALLIVPMSSGRLFLDRVARQHCPSPLHRHPQINMLSSEVRAKGDISTLQERGHFYFALTRATARPHRLTSCDSLARRFCHEGRATEFVSGVYGAVHQPGRADCQS
jgi:hypothetical protein